MARFSLQLAFVVSALGFVYPKCCESVNQPQIPFIDLMLYIPAILMGSWYWWKGRSFASSWPVIAGVLLVWTGVAYAGNSESDRGFLIAALLTIVLPVAALIVEKRAWMICAKTYVIANGVAMAIAIWHEMGGDLVNPWVVLHRFGFLWAKDGVTQTANPNQVGGQLALAAIIAFIIYLKDLSAQKRPADGPNRANMYLGLAAFLSAGCLLTASRGAAASWLVGMGILTIWGTRSQSPARQKGLAFLMSGGLLLVTFGVVASNYSPWENLQKRIGQDSVFSLGNRMTIWQDAYTAWTSDPDYFLRGTGTGMADEVLGRITWDAEEDDYGVLRKNCHNSFVELILSFGLLGIVIGTALAASIIHKALLLDHGEQNVGRLAILLAVLVFSLTAVSYRHPCWLATGSLVLAMVSGSPARRRRSAAATLPAKTSESANDVPAPHSRRPDRDKPIDGPRLRKSRAGSRIPHHRERNRERYLDGE